MDVTELAAELRKAGNIQPAAVQAVVAKGAQNVKNQLQSEAGRSRHFRIARWINYDIKAVFGGARAEIGPEKAGAGNLGVIAYFGSSRGGGASLPDPAGALNDELPGFEAALAALVKL